MSRRRLTHLTALSLIFACLTSVFAGCGRAPVSFEPTVTAAETSAGPEIQSWSSYRYLPCAPLDAAAVQEFTAFVGNVSAKFGIKDAYCAVVPCRNWYIYLSQSAGASGGDKAAYFDWPDMESALRAQLGKKYIDVASLLTLDDFGELDDWWRQDRLDSVTGKLGEVFGFELNAGMSVEKYPNYGGVYGDSGHTGDFYYVQTDAIQASSVSRLEDYDTSDVYDLERLGSGTAYDLFFGGDAPILQAINAMADNSRRLVIIGDSLARSLAPLLLSVYHEVTIIDLRYINSDLVPLHVDLTGDFDTLFLYSSETVNSPLCLEDLK